MTSKKRATGYRRLPIVVLMLGSLYPAVPLRAQDSPPLSAGVVDTKQSDTKQNPDLVAPVPEAGDPLYAPVVTSTKPQSLDDRFRDYAIAAFGPRTLFAPALWAGLRMANPPDAYPRNWRQGAGAFGRNYGDALASGASLQTARFLTSAILHEDFRYRRSSSTNPLARSLHALAFTFVDKSDSGHNRVAVSNFAGAAASGFVGNLYLPAGYNDLSHAESRAAISFAALAGQNLLREFVPDILRLTQKWHAPFPRLPVPEWWVKLKGR